MGLSMRLSYEQIAEICHEANRAYCQVNGDYTHNPWGLSQQEVKDSAISGVETHIKNPGITPEQSHESWLKFKEERGWTYGDVKDFDKKTHPCMKPYKALPQDQRVKDEIFTAIVETTRKF